MTDMMPEGRWLPGSLTPEHREPEQPAAGYQAGTAVVVVVSVVDPESLRADPRGVVSRRLAAAHWVRTHAGEFGPFVSGELIPAAELDDDEPGGDKR